MTGPQGLVERKGLYAKTQIESRVHDYDEAASNSRRWGILPPALPGTFTVSGGQFTGDRLSREVLPQGSSDFLLLRADGSYQQILRLVLQTEDQQLILTTYRGVAHASTEVGARRARGEQIAPSEYYLRTAPFFETASAKYAWLNKIVSDGIGERGTDEVKYEVPEIL